MVHVPYKGSAPAMIALIGGETVMGFSNAVATIPHVRAGRLKMLGVTTRTRSSLLPEVPTIAEAGLPGFENTIWSGIIVHAATPKPMQSALHEAISRAIESPQVREKLTADGAEPFIGDTPGAYGEFIAAEIAKWGKIVRQAGIVAQ
jgi:tripartite-type tricarboxylate transporter receptor subunit TctC